MKIDLLDKLSTNRQTDRQTNIHWPLLRSCQSQKEQLEHSWEKVFFTSPCGSLQHCLTIKDNILLIWVLQSHTHLWPQSPSGCCRSQPQTPPSSGSHPPASSVCKWHPPTHVQTDNIASSRAPVGAKKVNKDILRSVCLHFLDPS